MSKKGENIRKRKDGRWEGRYKDVSDTDKRSYRSVYGKTYKEVKEKLISARFEQKGISTASRNVKFSELLRFWLSSNEIRLKGGTYTKYRNIIESQIIPKLGELQTSEITSMKINTFLTQLSSHGRLDNKGGLSSSYIRSISFVITSAINFGVCEGLCSPLKSKINKPQTAKKDLVVISLEEQKKLETYILNNISSAGVGIMISLYCGLRIGEICALSWNDVDFINDVIEVNATISRVYVKSKGKTMNIRDTPKTESSRRTVPIPSGLKHVLTEFRKGQKNIYVVSDNETFVTPRTFEARFHRILKNSQIKDTNYHTLRHTFATRCIEAGVDVKTLSEVLGHADVSITLNTYVHSSMDRKKEQMEKLATFINNNGQKNGHKTETVQGACLSNLSGVE